MAFTTFDFDISHYPPSANRAMILSSCDPLKYAFCVKAVPTGKLQIAFGINADGADICSFVRIAKLLVRFLHADNSIVSSLQLPGIRNPQLLSIAM